MLTGFATAGAAAEPAKPAKGTIVISRAEFEALQTRLEALEGEVAELRKTADTAATETPAPEPAVTGGGAAQGVPQTELPDLSVIGNIVGRASSDKAAENRNDIVVREVELGLQGYLYPQVRADAFIALSEEHDSSAVLEEGYVTFLQPNSTRFFQWMRQDTSLRLGRKLLEFGKVNSQHPHTWQYVNAPTVIDNFMGHGFGGDGVAVGYLLPTRTFANLELGAWKFSHHHHHDEEEAEEEEAELGAGFGGKVYHARLWTSRPLSETRELELGLSGAVGHGDRHIHEEEITVHDDITMTGVDVTYKHWPAPHKRLLLQGEAIWHNREGGGEGRTSKGYYLFGNYQWDKYWDAGLLYNWSERPFPGEGHDSGVSAILTNHLTESTALRLQYDLNHRPGEGQVQEVWLQLLWGIGPHSHPLQ